MTTLGVNPSLLLGQIINFLILFFVLYKLVYKPLLQAIKKREEKFKETAEREKKIQTELAKIEETKKKILAKTRVEAEIETKAILAQAKKEKDVILAKAKQERQEIMDNAHEESASLQKESRGELKKQTVELATQIAAKLIGKNLKLKEQKRLTAQAVQELTKLE